MGTKLFFFQAANMFISAVKFGVLTQAVVGICRFWSQPQVTIQRPAVFWYLCTGLSCKSRRLALGSTRSVSVLTRLSLPLPGNNKALLSPEPGCFTEKNKTKHIADVKKKNSRFFGATHEIEKFSSIASVSATSQFTLHRKEQNRDRCKET